MGEPLHHPPEELLAELATGQLDRARRITVEAHAAFCGACRSAVAAWAAPGGALLAEVEPAEPPPSSFADLEARIDALEPEDDTPPSFAPAPPVPPGVRGLLPTRLFDRRWRRLPLSSARFAMIDHDPEADTTLLMVHIGPDRRFPRHEHLGAEDVVVLEGAFRDAQGLFRQGDYQQSLPGTVHRPQAQPGAHCWILTRFESQIRFTGVRGALQRLGG